MKTLYHKSHAEMQIYYINMKKIKLASPTLDPLISKKL